MPVSEATHQHIQAHTCTQARTETHTYIDRQTDRPARTKGEQIHAVLGRIRLQTPTGAEPGVAELACVCVYVRARRVAGIRNLLPRFGSKDISYHEVTVRDKHTHTHTHTYLYRAQTQRTRVSDTQHLCAEPCADLSCGV